MLTKLSDLGQTLCLVFAAIGTTIVAFLGGWDMLLYALLVCIIIDYISGIYCAIIEKKLSSAVGFQGIAKKVFILVLVGMAHMLGQALGLEFIRNMVICFYLANEGISILENAGKTGIPVPQKLKDILIQLKKDNDIEITENTDVK